MISLMADYNDNMIKYGLKIFITALAINMLLIFVCVCVCVCGGGGGGGGSVIYMIK